MNIPVLKLHHFIEAHRRISPYIRHTPLIYSKHLSRHCQAEVWLKAESLQPTGSFKIRGALNKLTTMSPQQLQAGLVTASAGNHALGLAYAAESLNISGVTIFVPVNTPTAKLDKLSHYPITLHPTGTTYTEAHHHAQAFADQTGAHYISAYDDPDIITGQGTCGLEIMLGLPTADLILVPTGGGGLLAGTALTAKAINPLTQIIGVQPDASPAAKLSFQQGIPLDPYDHQPTLAEGLAGGFGATPFYLARTLIDDILLHTETDIKNAVFTLAHHEQLMVEASGAIAIAPLLTHSLNVQNKTVVCILTGANIDTQLLAQIITEQNSA